MDSYELALELGRRAKRRGVTVQDQVSGTSAALSRIRTVLKKRCLE